MIQVIPGQLTDQFDTELVPLGLVVEGDPRRGDKYVFYKNACYADDGTTEQSILDGEVIMQCTRAADANAMFEGTNNASLAVIKLGAAIAISTIEFGKYGFAQVRGVCAFGRTDTAGVAEGDPLIADTNDGELDTVAAGEEHLVMGFAQKDDTTIVDDQGDDQEGVELVLTNCLWGT